MTQVTAPNEPPMGLKEQLAVLRYRKWSVAAVVAAVVGAALLLTALQTRVYSSTAAVLVKWNNTGVVMLVVVARAA